MASESSDDLGDDENICRICRTGAEEDRPLFFPCMCNGSIRYVHQDCLLQWLTHSNAKYCELCKTQFEFTPVYVKDAPANLPPTELWAGAFKLGSQYLCFSLRLLLVIVLWIFVVPVATCWACRLFFVRSLHDVLPSIFRWDSEALTHDWLCGSCLSAIVVITFLGFTSLREYLATLDNGFEMGDVLAVADADTPERADVPNAQAENRAPDEPVAAEVAEEAAAVPVDDVVMAEGAAADFGFGFFDGNQDEMPLDVLVGIKGPVRHLVENVITVLASNSIFVATFTLLPFSVGRLFFQFQQILRVRLISNKDNSTGVTLVVGYLYIVVGIMCYVLASIAQSRRTRSPLSPVVKQLLSAIQCAYTLCKVSSVLFVQLGIFPALCGCWLDLCTLAMLDAELESRLHFFRTAAVTCTLLHWLIGLIYMLYVSLFVSVLREFLRPEVLWFLRNPDDPDYHPFRELVEESILTHVKRVVLSGVIYGTLILLLVWCPIQLAVNAVPSVFPVNAEFGDPYTDVPADLLLFHICVPFTIEHCRPRTTIKALLIGWFRTAGNLLGLTPYLFPLPPPGVAARAEPAVAGEQHDEPATLQPDADGLGAEAAVQADGGAVAYAESLVADGKAAVSAEADGKAAVSAEADGKAAVSAEPEKPGVANVSAKECGAANIEEQPKTHAQQSTSAAGTLSEVDSTRAAELGSTRTAADAETADHTMGEPMVVADERVVVDSDAAEWPALFGLRISSLLLAAWLTLMSSSVVCGTIPLVLGRYLTSVVLTSMTHDVYSFGVGFYVIWFSVEALRVCHDMIGRHRLCKLLEEVCTWSLVGLKLLVIGSLWLGIIPLMIGLLFELTVLIPMRVPLWQNPTFFGYQDWAFGFLYLKIWVRLLMVIPSIAPTWRAKFEQARQDGIQNLDLLGLLHSIIFPAISLLALFLAVPYCLGRAIVPQLNLGAELEQAVWRYSYPLTAIFMVLVKSLIVVRRWYAKFYDAIRDEKYLVGRQLHNYPNNLATEPAA